MDRRASAKRWPGAVLLFTLLMAGTTPLAGQTRSSEGWEAGRVHVGLYGGQLVHSLLGVVAGTLTDVGGTGLSVAASADVEAEGAMLVGGVLGARLSPSLAVRVRAAQGDTHMRLAATTRPLSGPGLQLYTYGGLGQVSVRLVDVEVVWVPRPATGRLRPYVFAGLGASNWRISGLEDIGSLPPLLESPVNLRPVDPWLPSGVVGGGLALRIGGGMSVQIEASDHMSGNPFEDDDFRIGSSFAGTGAPKNLVHSMSVSTGLRVDLGR
jgi:hypothetical protein